MKKRHYIQLAILLIITFVYVSLKTGTLRIEHTKVWEPTESVLTVQVVDATTGKTNEHITLSVDEQEIEIDMSDYQTDSDYKQAIEQAKTKLGFRKK